MLLDPSGIGSARGGDWRGSTISMSVGMNPQIHVRMFAPFPTIFRENNSLLLLFARAGEQAYRRGHFQKMEGSGSDESVAAGTNRINREVLRYEQKASLVSVVLRRSRIEMLRRKASRHAQGRIQLRDACSPPVAMRVGVSDAVGDTNMGISKTKASVIRSSIRRLATIRSARQVRAA